ncbi:MAG: hypothetical protein CM15mP74_29580 [Halieaceae bacterium]|nr:MAG: hypothetical protein CM15mP74_29580 [Halieaceae bacterium]
MTEFKAKHFPTLVSFINAELDMDTLVSVIDPVWNETLPTSYIFNREGEVVKKCRAKTHCFFQGAISRCGSVTLHDSRHEFRRDFSLSGDSRGSADGPPQMRR